MPKLSCFYRCIMGFKPFTHAFKINTQQQCPPNLTTFPISHIIETGIASCPQISPISQTAFPLCAPGRCWKSQPSWSCRQGSWAPWLLGGKGSGGTLACSCHFSLAGLRWTCLLSQPVIPTCLLAEVQEGKRWSLLLWQSHCTFIKMLHYNICERKIKIKLERRKQNHCFSQPSLVLHMHQYSCSF